MSNSEELVEHEVFKKYESGMVDSWSWHLTIAMLDAARFSARLERIADLPFCDSGAAEADFDEDDDEGSIFLLDEFKSGGEFCDFVIGSFSVSETRLNESEWLEIIANIRKVSSALAREIGVMLAEDYGICLKKPIARRLRHPLR